MLKTLERFLLAGIIVIVAFLYGQQSIENLRLYAQIQKLTIQVNQLQIDLKHYTDPAVIQERTINMLLGQEEEP